MLSRKQKQRIPFSPIRMISLHYVDVAWQIFALNAFYAYSQLCKVWFDYYTAAICLQTAVVTSLGTTTGKNGHVQVGFFWGGGVE